MLCNTLNSGVQTQSYTAPYLCIASIAGPARFVSLSVLQLCRHTFKGNVSLPQALLYIRPWRRDGLLSFIKLHMHAQDKVQEADSRAVAKAPAPASPDKSKMATRLRAELEVHKEALAASKEETVTLTSSLAKASGMIEVRILAIWQVVRLALESQRPHSH